MTITEITWGDPIDAANGGKPLPWLKADEKVYCIWDKDTHSGPYPVERVRGWNEGFQIKLPADHDYYQAVARGFTYWPGGDSAPDDWDGGEVLLEGGDIEGLPCPDWGRGNHIISIIGYHKRTEPAGDYVRVKRMTLDEAYEFSNRFGGSNEYGVALLSELGLIKYETLLEQFEREQGSLDGKSGGYARGVKDAISWMEKRNV